MNEKMESLDNHSEEAAIDQTQSEEVLEGLGEELLDTAEKTSDVAIDLKQKDEKIAELTYDLQRTRADFENFRRQKEAERMHIDASIRADMVKKMLPILDDFELAAVNQPDAMAPLAKSFEKTLKKLEITKIESKAGTAFNPELHVAMSAEGDGDKDVISESLQSGYYYKGQVVRPALVKVIKK